MYRIVLSVVLVGLVLIVASFGISVAVRWLIAHDRTEHVFSHPQGEELTDDEMLDFSRRALMREGVDPSECKLLRRDGHVFYWKVNTWRFGNVGVHVRQLNDKVICTRWSLL